MENPTYRNKCLKSLKDEIWKDIPGFDGYYLCSSYGRIKALARQVPHKSGKLIWTKEKIMSQTARYDANQISNDTTVLFRFSICYQTKRYDLSVRRVVYEIFHRPLKQGEVVVCKDFNGYNCHYENLEAITNREKALRSIQRGRNIPSLIYLDRSKFKTHGSYKRRKPVIQYDREGNEIARYEGIRAAARATGFGDKEIIMAAKGRWRHYNQYVWKYATNEDS